MTIKQRMNEIDREFPIEFARIPAGHVSDRAPDRLVEAECETLRADNSELVAHCMGARLDRAELEGWIFVLILAASGFAASTFFLLFK